MNRHIVFVGLGLFLFVLSVPIIMCIGGRMPDFLVFILLLLMAGISFVVAHAIVEQVNSQSAEAPDSTREM